MKSISLILFVLVSAVVGFAQPVNHQLQQGYMPTQQNLDNREWFKDNKFGLFVHWGVYSMLGDGEWTLQQKDIPTKTYEQVASFFYPTDYNPAEWVAMVKKAGMKYITITSKHHDGFAMYDSKVSDYDIIDRTHYKKDALKMLKEECDKQGIKLFFYYSQLDWHHPDFGFRLGLEGRPKTNDWDKYIDYMNAQLTELLTNYGEVGGIWFDGMWSNKKANWRLDETYALIHKLQPGALIGSNHHMSPISGEDFQMFERDLPGENTMGFNEADHISEELPLEMCETMGSAWGYNIHNQKYKTSKQLIQTMVKAAGYGANFLLNVGPMPNGEIEPENIDTLAIMGKWLEKYGSTIYNTRRGPIKPADWGSTTVGKDGKIYIHLLNLKAENLLLPTLPGKLKTAVYFDGGEKVIYKETEFGIVINVPKSKQDEIDTILVFELKNSK